MPKARNQLARTRDSFRLGLLSLALAAFAAQPMRVSADTIVLQPSGQAEWADLVVTQSSAAPWQIQAVGTTAGFDAVTDNGTTSPANPSGAVGPDHIMTMTSSEVRIQNRAGVSVVSNVTLDDFWAMTGATGVVEPKLVYDPGASRWFAVSLVDAGLASSSVLFATSGSTDPTGSWTFYRIDADATDVFWVTKPQVGLNSKWVGITGDMFRVIEGTFRGSAMWVIDKPSAVAGGALTIEALPVRFDRAAGFSNSGVSPCFTYGAEPTLYLIDSNRLLGFGVLRLSQITENLAGTPVWSVVPGSLVAGGSGLFSAQTQFDTVQIDARQPGTAIQLETNDFRVQSAVFRNGRVWATHTGGLPVNSVNRTAVFWHEIDPTGMPAPTIQSGSIGFTSNTHHFFPSVAVNASNDVCLGFTRSDGARFPQAAATGRVSSDALGAMDPVAETKLGETAFLRSPGGSPAPWGGYSATVVDPSDDLGFWTLQSYAAQDVGPNPEDDRWGTWWAAKGVAISGACCDSTGCTDGVALAACQTLGGTLSPGVSCSAPCSCPANDTQPDPVIPDGGNGTTNRYLSFSAGAAGAKHAIRVILADLPAPFDSLNGRVMWVGEPHAVTENSGLVSPAGMDMFPSFMASSLRCTPYFDDWSAFGVVRVSSTAIVPAATYELQVIGDDCIIEDESRYSMPVSIATSAWGDVVGTCDMPPCTPSNGSVDLVSDIAAMIDKFRNIPGAPVKARVDVAPAMPNRIVEISDFVRAIGAFEGNAFPFPVPDLCPEGGTTAGTMPGGKG